MPPQAYANSLVGYHPVLDLQMHFVFAHVLTVSTARVPPQAYANSLVDHHLVLDLLPGLAGAYFARRLPVSLTYGQVQLWTIQQPALPLCLQLLQGTCRTLSQDDGVIEPHALRHCTFRWLLLQCRVAGLTRLQYRFLMGRRLCLRRRRCWRAWGCSGWG